MNQNEREVGLINNDNNLSLKKGKLIFNKPTNKRFNERIESINKTNFDDLIYY